MSSNFSDTLVFVKVVERGSFIAAAQSLGLPRTTVSRRVSELERRLGVQLLHRSTRRLALTEAGALYHGHCQRIVDDLAAAEHAVSELGRAPRGNVRITLAHSLATELVAPLLAEFSDQHPDMRIDMVLSNERLDLIANELDLALRLAPAALPDSGLAARALGVIGTELYASPGYLQRCGQPAGPSDLARHRCLALAAHRHHGQFLWRLRSRSGEATEAVVHPVLVADDPAPLAKTAAADGGLVLASGRVLAPLLASGRLLRVLPDWSGPQLTLYGLYPREKRLAPKLRVLIDFLAERLPIPASEPVPVTGRRLRARTA